MFVLLLLTAVDSLFFSNIFSTKISIGFWSLYIGSVIYLGSLLLWILLANRCHAIWRSITHPFPLSNVLLKERFEFVMLRGAVFLFIPYLDIALVMVVGRFSGSWSPPTATAFWIGVLLYPLQNLTSLIITAAIINAIVYLSDKGFVLSLSLLASMLVGSLLGGLAQVDYGAWKKLDSNHVFRNILFRSDWLPWVFSFLLITVFLVALAKQRKATWRTLFVWLLVGLLFDNLTLGLLSHYPPGMLVIIQRILLAFPSTALEVVPVNVYAIVSGLLNSLTPNSNKLVHFELTMGLTKVLELAEAFGIVLLVGLLLRWLGRQCKSRIQALPTPCPPQA